jgi:hypothetical protein
MEERMSAQSPAKLAEDNQTDRRPDGELSDLELDQVAGGFNPQPDPPGRANVWASSFVSPLVSKGIIVIGG